VVGIRIVMLMIAGGLLSACAKTSMTSTVSPIGSETTYSRVLVQFPVPDIRLREFVEYEFATQVPAVFIAGHLLFPPTREYTNEEVLSRLIEEDIDALLLVRLSDAGTSTKQVEASRATACSIRVGRRGGCYQGFTAPTGGGAIDQSWAFFEASLMDMTTREVVWTGSAESKGSQFSGSDDVLRSMARKAVERLRADGVIR
jgi:hypothetical protein